MSQSFLCVLNELPVPNTGGGILLGEIFALLSQWGEVHIVVPVLPHQRPMYQSLQSDFSRTVASWTELIPINRWGKRNYTPGRLLSGLPGGIYNFATRENEQRLAGARARLQPSREVAVSTWAVAAYPNRRFTSQTYLYMVNVDHEIVGAAPANLLRRMDGLLERNRVRKHCIGAIQSAGKVAAITARDAEALRRESGRADIQVVPPLMRPKAVVRDQVQPGAILLPTNYTYAHNRVSLTWLLEEVWPRIDSAARLRVTGRDDSRGALRRLCQRYERVEYLGCLPQMELEQQFARAMVCVNPTLSGSGFQIKLLDALSRGVPVVTTRFSNHIGPEMPSSDDPRQFAELVNTVLKSIRVNYRYDSFYNEAVKAWMNFLNLTEMC